MKKIALAVLLCSVMLMCTAGCVSDENVTVNENVSQNVKESEAPEVKNIETIYSDDESINLFINRFNEINEDKITADMIYKEHIGGRDRDDVVSVRNDKFEINIYGGDIFAHDGKYDMNVFVRAHRSQDATPDDYKELFVKYIKVFDNTLTNEEIDNHWNILLSDYHSSYEINDIDILVSSNMGTIEYFKFTKTLQF